MGRFRVTVGSVRAGLAGLVVGAALLTAPALRADDRHIPEEIAGLDAKGQEDAARFITDNVIAVLFHEAGHMLVSELDLPVLGREEDAVDTLSSLLLLEAKDSALDQALMDTVDSWLALGDAQGTPAEEQLMDTHGLDKQRAYNIACMMVGQDQVRFKDFADRIKLPQARRDQCETEYQKARTSWFSVLNPHMADDKDTVDFKIDYTETNDPDLAYYRDMLKDVGLLEMLRDTFSGFIKLKGGIRLTAGTCGQTNAFWSPADRQLTYCYEDARSYARIFAQSHPSDASAASEPMDDTPPSAPGFLANKTGGGG